MLDFEEFDRWFRSARLTLESARHDLEVGDYCWACFKAHQAAEKALKALLWGLGSPVLSCMLNRLLNHVRELGVPVPDEIEHFCLILNRYYISTRYPDVWSEGVPEEYFTRDDAENAIKSAELVLSWVDSVWRRLLRRD